MRLSVAGAAKDAQVQNDIFLKATSPATSSWSAGSLIPIPTSRRACRRGALIALLWRFRMPLEAPSGALSHFLLAECFGFSSSPLLLLWLWLLLAFARLLLPPPLLNSYITCPLPLCVVIAPFFLAFISPAQPASPMRQR